ncbi:hypothetical protein ACTXT7_017582 [Hymenolepis weldensis]
MKKLIEEIIGDYVWADPTEVPTVMRTHFPPTVMAFGVVKGSEGGKHHDSSMTLESMLMPIVKTPQTIVLKAPRVDSVANGGRPLYVFLQRSAPSHKALKIHDWMDGWPRIFTIMSHQSHGLLTTHQTLILLALLRVGQDVVEKEANKHSHYAKSSSFMEAIIQAISRAMEDINKDHLIKACSQSLSDSN